MPIGLSKQRKERAYLAEQGIRPRFHKGIRSCVHSYWTCGNCGTSLKYAVCENFCHNCGYRILWDNPRCLTGYH